MPKNEKSPFPVFGGKDDGNDPVSKTERNGKDLSNFFSRVILKHDLQKAASNSTAYPLYDSAGNVVGMMNPATGQMTLNNPGSGVAPTLPSMPTFKKSAQGKDRSASAFRALGAQDARDKENEERQERLKEFVKSITEKEFRALESLSRDRILINENEIRKAHKKGKETGFERLIELDLARWDKFDTVLEIRLTPLGRRVYESFV